MSKRKTPPATTGTTATTSTGQTGTTTGNGQTGTTVGSGHTGTTAGSGHTGATGSGHTHKKPAKPPAQSSLAGPLLRNMQDSWLAGLNLHGDPLGVALGASPDLFGQTALKLGRAATILPRNVLTAETRPIFARLQWDGQDTFTRKSAHAIQLSGMVPSVQGTTPEMLNDLVDKKDVYQGFKLLGDRVHDSGMDLRLIYGAFQFYMVEKVMTYLEARFADPNLTRSEMGALLDHFGPALIKIDEALSKAPQSKAQLAGLRDQATAQAQDAQDEANMQDVIYQLHSGITPQRAKLLQAAQRHLKLTTAQGGAGAPAAGTTSPLATIANGKTIR